MFANRLFYIILFQFFCLHLYLIFPVSFGLVIIYRPSSEVKKMWVTVQWFSGDDGDKVEAYVKMDVTSSDLLSVGHLFMVVTLSCRDNEL